MLLAGLFALVYLLLCCRIHVDARLTAAGRSVHLRAHLRAAGARVCLDAALSGSVSGDGVKRQAAIFRRYGSLMRAGSKTIRLGQMDIRAAIGLGDAAQTALAAGCLQAALLSIGTALGFAARTDVRIVPDFRSRRVGAHARCIISIVPGDLIFAVAKEAVKKTQREGFEWLSTPLKA